MNQTKQEMPKMESLSQVRVPVDMVLGSTSLTLEELSRLREGCIIEFPSLAGEPVNLVAAGEVVARGEVVIVDENFGIRITAVLD